MFFISKNVVKNEVFFINFKVMCLLDFWNLGRGHVTLAKKIVLKDGSFQ
jgi:hypothetical protein